ncbi:MAG: DEAD/DEAH box helicase [Acidimicrobiia bacterium]
MSSFSDLGLAPDLVHALISRGIKEPFPVQAATIPDALAGKDVCGRAPTGSGKTIAFGAPTVERVEAARPRRPSALILAPTRELAAQITRELEPMASIRNQRVFAVYGGVGYEPQKRALRKGVEILVACPGRLEDLIAQRALVLDRVSIVVIDEADRMADMGFLPAVRRILDQTNLERQTLLFSATLDGAVGVLTDEYQRFPVRHEVAGVESDAADAEHRFERISSEGRLTRAAEVIGTEGPTIVFCRTRHGADKVAKKLSQHGVESAPIHGGLSQAKRDRALQDFARGRVHALIATDVAARGIHVDDVACVVHFDPPEDAKAYVHRSGRTARKGATGVVVSFVLPDQVRSSLSLQRELGLVEPDYTPEKRSRPAKDRGNRGQGGRPAAHRDRNRTAGTSGRRSTENTPAGRDGGSGGGTPRDRTAAPARREGTPARREGTPTRSARDGGAARPDGTPPGRTRRGRR